MALFKVHPNAKAQHDAASKLRVRRRDRDAVAEQLKTFEAKVIERRAAALALVTDGGHDDPKLTSIETEVRVAEERIRSLTGGLAGIDKDIAGLERTIDGIVDKRCRNETAAAVNTMADELAEAQANFTKAAQRLEAAARESGLLIPEGRAVAEFTLSAREQLPPAVEMVVAGLKAHSRGVLVGHGSPSLPRPAAPPVKLAIVPSEPAAVNVFALKNLKFVNREGGVTTICKNKRHDLPKALAELAISSNMALPLSEKKRIEDLEYNAESFFVPSEQSCVWLGPKGRESPPLQMKPGPAPVHHSLTEFTVVDRGPPIVGMMKTTPVEPMAKTGTRSAPEE